MHANNFLKKQVPLIVVGLAAIVLLLSFIFEHISSKSTYYQDFEKAKSDFEKKCCSDTTWFVPQSVLSSVRLAVNLDSSKLLVINGKECIEVPYTSSTLDIKLADKEAFAEVLKKNFPLLRLNDSLSAARIAQLMGADTAYLSAIAADSKLSAENIAFSLLYNTVVGDSFGHCAVTVENSRLVKKSMMAFSMLEQQRFVAAMNENQHSDSLDAIVLKNSVNSACRFVYLDLRKDKLHVGTDVYDVKDEVSQLYLPQLKSQPGSIFYLDGSELRALQPTDCWGTLDVSKVHAAEKDAFAAVAAVLQSLAVRIIAILLLLGAGAFYVVMLRKNSAPAANANTIGKLIITWDNNKRNMKQTEPKPVNANPDSEAVKSSDEDQITIVDTRRETKIAPNQFVFENFPCDEEGLLEILEKIDKKKGSNMADLYREQQRKCDKLRQEKESLQRDLAARDSELKRVNQNLSKADGIQAGLRKEISDYKQQLADRQKDVQQAVKKRQEAEDNYKTVSNWKPYLEKTRGIMEDVDRQIAALPSKETSEDWSNLRVAVLVHAAMMKLLEVWSQDRTWQEKMHAKDFQTVMENGMLLLEKLKQSVNALCLKGNLNNSKDIDAEVRKKVLEGYGHAIAAAPNPKLDDILNKSITARVAFEQAKPFMDAMWENFVKEFVSENPVEKGKAWYFEHIINIAYHAVDYVLMQVGQDKSFCFNYQFLESQFNPQSPVVRPFEYRHAEKSSQISNTVYEWTTEMGIEHLRVLIEKYFVKP